MFLSHLFLRLIIFRMTSEEILKAVDGTGAGM